MTGVVAGRRIAPETGWNWGRERLMSLGAAARRLGRDPSTLRGWVQDHPEIPSVATPGGHVSLYDSWVTAVLASARPGKQGDMTEVSRLWWAERGQEAAV
jgi:hypothetical protein